MLPRRARGKRRQGPQSMTGIALAAAAESRTACSLKSCIQFLRAATVRL
jgi:hypothetical protein